jgi:hypothetical protein
VPAGFSLPNFVPPSYKEAAPMFIVLVTGELHATPSTSKKNAPMTGTQLLVCLGNPDVVNFVKAKQGPGVLSRMSAPSEFWRTAEFTGAPAPGLPEITQKERVFIIGTINDVIRLAFTPNLRADVKYYSIYYAAFPMVRSYMETEFDPVPFDRYATCFSDVLAVEEAYGSLTPGQTFLMLSAIAALLPSWTKSTKITEQLWKRVKVTVRTDDFGLFTKTDCDGILARTEFRVDNDCVWTPDILGRIVCITKAFKFNVNVEKKDLAEPVEMVDHFKMHPWMLELLIQMRMVYEGCRNQSVRFAISVIDFATEKFHLIGGRFNDEIGPLRIMAAELATRKYVGLQSSIPERYQVKNVPRACELGYQMALLNGSEAQRTTLKEYVTNAWREFFKDNNDNEVCDALAFALPSQNIITWALTIAHMSLPEATNFLANVPKAKPDPIYYAIHKKVAMKDVNYGDGGAWFAHMTKIKQGRIRTEHHSAVQSMLKTIIDNKADGLRSLASSLSTDEAIRLAKKKINNWEDTAKESLASSKNLEDILPARLDMVEEDARRVYLAELEKLIDKIKADEPWMAAMRV